MAKSDLDADLAALPKKSPRKKTECVVGEHARVGGAAVRNVVDDLGYSADAVAAVLTKHLGKCSASAVRGHRRHKCACYGVGN